MTLGGNERGIVCLQRRWPFTQTVTYHTHNAASFDKQQLKVKTHLADSEIQH